MLYAHVTPKEYEQLVQTKRQSRNVRKHERLHLIQLFSQEKSVLELAKWSMFEPIGPKIISESGRVGKMPSKRFNMGTKLSRHFAHHQ